MNQIAMFEPTGTQKHRAPDMLEIHAREKLGLPDGWVCWFRKCLPEDAHPAQAFHVQGCVPGVVARGPRKGKPDYKNGQNHAVAIIGCAEHKAWSAKWCKQHDKCLTCLGEGRLFVSVGKDGTRYRPCKACGETGRWQGGES